MVIHGTADSGYKYHGCRCDQCTRAHADTQRIRREIRVRAPKDPGDPRHGKVSFYVNHGCRCDTCRAAYQENKQARKAKLTEEGGADE